MLSTVVELCLRFMWHDAPVARELRVSAARSEQGTLEQGTLLDRSPPLLLHHHLVALPLQLHSTACQSGLSNRGLSPAVRRSNHSRLKPAASKHHRLDRQWATQCGGGVVLPLLRLSLTLSSALGCAPSLSYTLPTPPAASAAGGPVQRPSRLVGAITCIVGSLVATFTILFGKAFSG